MVALTLFLMQFLEVILHTFEHLLFLPPRSCFISPIELIDT